MTRRAPIRPPRTYVVRVYRIRQGTITGQLEDVDDGSVRLFSSAEQLWLLIGGRPKASPRGGSRL